MRSLTRLTQLAVGAGALVLMTPLSGAADSPKPAPDRLDVPDGVRFKPGRPAVNEAARKKLQTAFATPQGNALSSLFGTMVICGPGLWQWLRQAPGAAAIGKPSPMMVPLSQPPAPMNLQQLDGRSYFDRAATRGFLAAFRAGLPPGGEPIVRRPTRQEIIILWALIPFDLEDPLFVVEIDGHHLILVMASDGKHILWLDDLAGMSFPPGKEIALPSPPPYAVRSASAPTAPAAAAARAPADGGPPP